MVINEEKAQIIFKCCETLYEFQYVSHLMDIWKTIKKYLFD